MSLWLEIFLQENLSIITKLSNILKNEKSPYLQQHKDNPVDWFPHVMAHESFENEETAKLMNEKFINIKVDREERPDLDYVFQKSLSILTGAQGGWPLSMFLDENGVPFTGGTYFPPKEIQGRPDFKKVLNNVHNVYKENREKILAQAPQVKDIFSKINQRSAVLNQPLEPFVEKIINYLDESNGSFKGAPKFPQFYLFDAMFYFYLKTKNINYFKPVETLLTNLCSKGIYDHLDGGISRYAVDEKWIIPHFEKMLYDNIQFIDLLTKFYQNTKNNYFKDKLLQTIHYFNNDFKNNEKLYGSAYDADSEGVEGKYYVWSYEELKNLLKEDIKLLENKYEISDTIETIEILNTKLHQKIIHCYENKEIETFLEDYVYYALLMITLYEVNADKKALEKSIKIMNDTWELFFNKETQLFQKNIIKDNDLFASPLDLNDSNIPNGNSVYLLISNKLYSITNDKIWSERNEVLKKSFHQVLNSYYSQMFSFIKTLDICDNSLSFTFSGTSQSIKEIQLYLQKEYLGVATFVYQLNNDTKPSVIVCKNQTCSNKLTNINEAVEYLSKSY